MVNGTIAEQLGQRRPTISRPTLTETEIKNRVALAQKAFIASETKKIDSEIKNFQTDIEGFRERRQRSIDQVGGIGSENRGRIRDLDEQISTAQRNIRELSKGKERIPKGFGFEQITSQVQSQVRFDIARLKDIKEQTKAQKRFREETVFIDGLGFSVAPSLQASFIAEQRQLSRGPKRTEFLPSVEQRPVDLSSMIEQRSFISGQIQAGPDDTSFIGGIERRIQKAETAQFRGEPSFLGGVGGGVASSLISTSRFAKELIISPIKTTKGVFTGGVGFTKRFLSGEGFPEIGRIIQQRPGFALGFLGTEIVTARGAGAVGAEAVKITRKGTTIIDPRFIPVQTLDTGKQIIPAVSDIGDIKLLPKGAGFGFSRAEQAEFIGKTGPVATSARDLFKRFQPEVKVAKGESGLGLFATPFELSTGAARTRISRLGGEAGRASIIDILSGDVTFKRPKPQIVVFPKQTIGDPKGFQPFGFPSSELEVTLPPGSIIKKEGVRGVTLIEGTPVQIIEAGVGGAKVETQRLLNLQRTGKLTTKQRDKLGNLLRKETGFGDISKSVGPTKFIDPIGLGVSVSLGIGKSTDIISPRPRRGGRGPTIPTRPISPSISPPIIDAGSLPVSSPAVSSLVGKSPVVPKVRRDFAPITDFGNLAKGFTGFGEPVRARRRKSDRAKIKKRKKVKGKTKLVRVVPSLTGGVLFNLGDIVGGPLPTSGSPRARLVPESFVRKKKATKKKTGKKTKKKK